MGRVGEREIEGEWELRWGDGEKGCWSDLRRVGGGCIMNQIRVYQEK